MAARRGTVDERQSSLFGEVLPQAELPPRRQGAKVTRSAAQPAAADATSAAISSPTPIPDPSHSAPPPAGESIEALAERLLPDELDALASALPDDRLASLALAAVRQLRRRVGRSGPRGGRARLGRGVGDPVGRALRLLAEELGGMPGE